MMTLDNNGKSVYILTVYTSSLLPAKMRNHGSIEG